MSRTKIVLFCLIITNFVGPAEAVIVDGSFTIEGPITWLDRESFALAPLAAYGATDAATGFTLSSPRVTVYAFDERYSEVATDGYSINLLMDGTHARFTLSEVEISQWSDDSVGWLGVYASPETSRLTIHANDSSILETRDFTVLGNPADLPFESEQYRKFYGRRLAGEHLYLATPGSFTLTGDFMLQIMGLDLFASARENTSTFETGDEASSRDMVHERTMRWIFLEVEDGELSFESRTPFEFAASSADASWDGRAVFDARNGQLASEDARYTSATGSTLIAGRFDARLLPAPSSGGNATLMALNGNLTNSNLAVARVNARPTVPDSSVQSGFDLASIVAVAVVSSVAVGAVAWRTRRRESSPDETLESCMAFLDLAIEAGDHARAAGWLKRARRVAPKSERLCREEAHYLGLMGCVDEALVALERGHALNPNGEAAYQATELLLRQSENIESAERWFTRALDADPGFLVHVDDNALFERLAGRRGFEAACARAQARLDDSTRHFVSS